MATTEISLSTQALNATLIPSKISTNPADVFIFPGALGIAATPVASAMLQIDSITKGFLAPRMTTAQRDAIVSPAIGLQIYNTDSNSPEVYDGTEWTAMGSAALSYGTLTAPDTVPESGTFNITGTGAIDLPDAATMVGQTIVLWVNIGTETGITIDAPSDGILSKDGFISSIVVPEETGPNSYRSFEFLAQGGGNGWLWLNEPLGSVVYFDDVFTAVADGTGQIFTLSSTATANSEVVNHNGLVLRPTVDYTISGTTLTILENVLTGDSIQAIYAHVTTAGGGGGGGGTPAGANMDIQYNDAGAFGADTGVFTYDSANNKLAITSTDAGVELLLGIQGGSGAEINLRDTDTNSTCQIATNDGMTLLIQAPTAVNIQNTLWLQDGNSGTPSYGFNNSQNSGMWLEPVEPETGSPAVHFNAAGTDVFYVDVNGRIQVGKANGGAELDFWGGSSLQFNSDAENAIYFNDSLGSNWGLITYDNSVDTSLHISGGQMGTNLAIDFNTTTFNSNPANYTIIVNPSNGQVSGMSALSGPSDDTLVVESLTGNNLLLQCYDTDEIHITTDVGGSGTGPHVWSFLPSGNLTTPEDVTVGGGLYVSGLVKFNLITTSSASYTVLDTDYTVLGDATSNVINVALPAASAVSGRILNFKKVDSSSNNVNVNRDGADLIDGQTSVPLTTQYQSVTIQSDGTNWNIL